MTSFISKNNIVISLSIFFCLIPIMNQSSDKKSESASKGQVLQHSTRLHDQTIFEYTHCSSDRLRSIIEQITTLDEPIEKNAIMANAMKDIISNRQEQGRLSAPNQSSSCARIQLVSAAVVNGAYPSQ